MSSAKEMFGNVRQMCKETKRPSHALFFFPDEKMTGIAKTRIITDGNTEWSEGAVVTVKWQAKKVRAEILALSDDIEVLNSKDLEWSQRNILKQPSQSSDNNQTQSAEKKSSESPSLHSVARPKTAATKTKAKTKSTAPHPYDEYLEKQAKRESAWSESRLQKKTKYEAGSEETPEYGIVLEKDDAIRQKLEARERDCMLLKDQLLNKESLCKKMDKFEEAVLNMEEKLAEKFEVALLKMERKLNDRLDRIEHRLDGLQVQPKPIALPLTLQESPIFEKDDLSTIDSDALAFGAADNHMNGQDDNVDTPLALGTIDSFEAEFEPLVSTPRNYHPPSCTQTSTHRASVSSFQGGEELITTCVTPSRTASVRSVLQTEIKRHKCAIKLLPIFFTEEEMSLSNTDGTHGKQKLDGAKLNAIKVLVFGRFPADSPDEREKIWKDIKS